MVMEKGAGDIQESLKRAAERNAAFESFCSLLDYVEADRPGFVLKFEERKKVWLDILLRGIQSSDPGLAGALDTRSLEDVSTTPDDEAFPDGLPPPFEGGGGTERG